VIFHRDGDQQTLHPGGAPDEMMELADTIWRHGLWVKSGTREAGGCAFLLLLLT